MSYPTKPLVVLKPKSFELKIGELGNAIVIPAPFLLTFVGSFFSKVGVGAPRSVC